MRKLAIVLGMLLLCQSAAAQIRVVPFIDCKAPDGVYLSIKNTGKKAELIEESQLPWLPSSSLIQLSVLGRNNGKLEELPADYMIWDTFRNPDITLAPGQIMHGFLSFNRVVSNFDSRRREGETLILLSSRQPLVPTRGVILIPKSGRFFGKDECPAYTPLPRSIDLTVVARRRKSQRSPGKRSAPGTSCAGKDLRCGLWPYLGY